MFACKHHGPLEMAVSMVGGASKEERSTEKGCSVNLPEPWSSTSLERQAVLTHRCGVVRLDNAFVLIEEHPHLI
jgi:hypothetical protein